MTQMNMFNSCWQNDNLREHINSFHAPVSVESLRVSSDGYLYLNQAPVMAKHLNLKLTKQAVVQGTPNTGPSLKYLHLRGTVAQVEQVLGYFTSIAEAEIHVKRAGYHDQLLQIPSSVARVIYHEQRNPLLGLLRNQYVIPSATPLHIDYSGNLVVKQGIVFRHYNYLRLTDPAIEIRSYHSCHCDGRDIKLTRARIRVRRTFYQVDKLHIEI